METYLFFLGSNPTLSAVESWTALKRDKLVPRIEMVDQKFLMINLERELPNDYLKSLGGVDRIAKLRGRQDHLWQAEELVETLSPAPAKFSLGIGTLNVDHDYSRRVGFEVKKLFKEEGVKARFVLPQGKSSQLNSAQVIFNKLTSRPNKELTIIEYDGEYLLVETAQIQNVQAYEWRDTSRPVRDARVGMLPPKLAQIMLNLVPEFVDNPPVILDPFCGLGTILQEGYLMGYDMIGSDVSERMVEASRINSESRVLSRRHLSSPRYSSASSPRLSAGRASRNSARAGCLSAAPPATTVFQHDVSDPFPEDLTGKVDAVVTEPDLGEPISTPLPQAKLEARMQESAELYLNFFKNIRPVLKDNAWIVFALPCFRVCSYKDDFILLPASFLDEVKKIGYRLNQLVPEELKQYYKALERGSIVYARPDALVGRELTLWHIKKPEGQHN